MRIWIDFINSPQVSFFEPLINELSQAGHEFILTCRDSANTVELLKQRNWSYKIIGQKAEKMTFKKALAFPLRIISLYRYLKSKQIHAAICQSSFYLPLTARLIGVPAIYTNDNEHALGNIPAFLFAAKILVPENLSLLKVFRQGANRNKVIQYPGIKEGVYLWPKVQNIQAQRNRGFTNKNIYIRPEPLTAQYYRGKHNFLDDFLLDLKDIYKVTILVRDKLQLEHYSQRKFIGISVPEKPLSFDDIVSDCWLFIGAGGSMTREMAIMGVPTISVYQGKLLEVDKFLIKEGLLVHMPDLNASDFQYFLKSKVTQNVNLKLIEDGKVAYELFKSQLLKYDAQ